MCFSFPIPRGDSLWLYSLLRGLQGLNKSLLSTIILNINIQPWCYTEVDDNGIGVKGTWADCGKNCPVDVNPWSTDQTLKVTHHYLDQKEGMIAVELYGIMASSLLLIALMVKLLGIYLVLKYEKYSSSLFSREDLQHIGEP